MRQAIPDSPGPWKPVVFTELWNGAPVSSNHVVGEGSFETREDALAAARALCRKIDGTGYTADQGSGDINRYLALEVAGNAMANPGKRPDAPDGAVLCVDPEKTNPPSGKFIVVRLPEGNRMFRQYVQREGRDYLVPLNPEYPEMEMPPGTEIIGTVTQINVAL